MAKAEEAAEAWLRKEDFDYQKYQDRRGGRDAYDTRMMYEISPMLIDAFLAGVKWSDEQERL